MKTKTVHAMQYVHAIVRLRMETGMTKGTNMIVPTILTKSAHAILCVPATVFVPATQFQFAIVTRIAEEEEVIPIITLTGIHVETNLII